LWCLSTSLIRIPILRFRLLSKRPRRQVKHILRINFQPTTGAHEVVVSTNWQEGSTGAVELARAVSRACEEEHKLRFLYDDNQSLREKIEIISKEIYGAGNVTYSAAAEKQIQQFTEQGSMV